MDNVTVIELETMRSWLFKVEQTIQVPVQGLAGKSAVDPVGWLGNEKPDPLHTPSALHPCHVLFRDLVLAAQQPKRRLFRPC